MKEIIIKYLNNLYVFKLSTYTTYKLYDKMEQRDVGLKEVFNTIIKVFNISDDELSDIFSEWADKKSIEINNKVVDIRNELYKTTGLELQLTVADLNKMIETGDMSSLGLKTSVSTENDKKE